MQRRKNLMTYLLSSFRQSLSSQPRVKRLLCRVALRFWDKRKYIDFSQTRKDYADIPPLRIGQCSLSDGFLNRAHKLSWMEAAYNRAYKHSYVGRFSALSVQLSNTNKRKTFIRGSVRYQSSLAIQISVKSQLFVFWIHTTSRLKVERTSTSAPLKTFESQYGLVMI